MNRPLLIVLALVAGLAVYLGSQGDDELLASPKAGQAQRKRGKDTAPGGPSTERRSAPVGGKTDLVEPWVAQALMDGVNRWQQRERASAQEGSTHQTVVAWAGVNPPPPPAPPKSVAEGAPPPPPPPMAPRFPHAWVGRFNDESLPQASGASAPALAVGARAVLTSPQSTWVVRVGDVIEGQWRIDRIQDRTMSLTYLPLQQQQTVVMR
ncbi:MAG TPA: hypothetical protein VFW93_13755 [Aquabacterium sp.]|uniref:hypothetical protein n=1 Tax=Aquabacterium sp. TaxID=1872578 RepID=UPI002E32F815|nr:hypothetical protein [Aquabacterium sp.]HEX5357279.1 hypothetical protein [Aquabacterium sp.]